MCTPLRILNRRLYTSGGEIVGLVSAMYISGGFGAGVAHIAYNVHVAGVLWREGCGRANTKVDCR
jgi:hypothetical protein